MPKKQQTNPKAAEARERKDIVKKDKQEKEKKAKEDAMWVVCYRDYGVHFGNINVKETDKHILQKEDRKKQAEDKKQLELDRKKQAREALAKEESDLTTVWVSLC